MAGLGASCSLLSPAHHAAPRPSAPLPIATSAVAPEREETIAGEMQVKGPCLTLLIRDATTDGPNVLPIWPIGFSAVGGEGQGIVLKGAIPPSNDAMNSERLELHGEYVDTAPPDATVPAGCETYRLFLVGRVLNIQM